MRLQKRKTIAVALTLFLCAALAAIAGDEGSWTGEVVDLKCYESRGAKGADHAACAAKCLESGEPMGLLTDDGTVVLLKAGSPAKAYDSLKSLAGRKASVTGVLAEKDGMKVVTVTGAKAG